MHEFEQLEDAALDALTPLRSRGLRTLEPYAGDLEVEELEEITLRFPCIYVIASGLGVGWDNRLDKYSMDLTLMVGDRHVRGAAAAARGDAASPGVYELLAGARDLLHNQKILEGWTPAQVQHEGPLVYAPKKFICIYIATYRLRAVK